MALSKVLYIDLEQVSSQIKDTINVEYYGDILFRKKKLRNYHESIYKELAVDFICVNNENALKAAIATVEYATDKFFLLQLGRFVVVNKADFQVFAEKINYVPESLAICDFQKMKGFLKLTKEQVLVFLHQLLNETANVVLHQFDLNTKIERFNLETFYIQIDNYPELIKLFQSSFELRYFNAIEKKELVITKKSVDKRKMYAEYSYYNHLDDAMKLYFLPTFGFKENEDTAQYSLERLKVPDVALQWIHFSFSDQEFEMLVRKLLSFVATRSTKEFANIKDLADDLYVIKVKERLTKLKAEPKFEQISKFLLSTTGQSSIDEVYESYFALYQKMSAKVYASGSLALSHGDLCFSNMLYDKRIELLKLIDPKGAPEKDALFLHPYYDIAKLSHSIMGKYDFINNGLFDFAFDENLSTTLKIHNGKELQSKELIFKKLLKENGLDYSIARLLEASLFLSMLPLHIDNTKKVVAFYINAKKILAEITNEI